MQDWEMHPSGDELLVAQAPSRGEHETLARVRP